MYISPETFKREIFRMKINPCEYEAIVCILNGGFYPAHYLSQKFDLPLHIVKVHSYDGKDQKEIVFDYDSGFDKIETNKKFLLVDDIYDSGKTIAYIRNKYHNCKFDVYTFITKQIESEYDHAIKFIRDDWVTFFWEKLTY